MDTGFSDNTLKDRLPVEIITLIIENLIPETSHHRPIFPASHVVTKTLLNLTLVSKAIYPIASRFLWQNCLRIESGESLRQFRDFISRESVVTGWKPCDAYGSTRLLIAPFVTPHRHDVVSGSIRGVPREETIDPPMHSDISSDCSASEFDDTIEVVSEVLIALAPVLKAIIVDMPPMCAEDSDTGVGRLFREGFEALVNIEEFVSINDELGLDYKNRSKPEIWTKWPKLQRLAFYHAKVEPRLWRNMLLCPQLKMAVLSRANPPGMEMDEQDIKDQWSRAWTEANTQGAMSFNDRVPYQGREITIAFCEWHYVLPNFDAFTHSWERLDPDNLIRIMTVPFVQPDDLSWSGYESHYPDIPKHWMRGRALRGSLWDDIHTECCDSPSRSDQDA